MSKHTITTESNDGHKFATLTISKGNLIEDAKKFGSYMADVFSEVVEDETEPFAKSLANIVVMSFNETFKPPKKMDFETIMEKIQEAIEEAKSLKEKEQEE